MKQTSAVEWLEKEFIKLESTIGVHGIMYELLEQAKEMEKEQIIETFGDSRILSITNNCNSGEQYYNETYGKTS